MKYKHWVLSKGGNSINNKKSEPNLALQQHHVQSSKMNEDITVAKSKCFENINEKFHKNIILNLKICYAPSSI